MTVNCNCPVCGSRNTKSLPVIYESGQRFSRYTRNSLWGSSRGSIWAGHSSTEGHSSNLLSDNAGPPGQLPWTSLVWIMVIVVFFFNLSLWVIPVVIVGVAILIGGSGFYIQSGRALEDWYKTFRCMRCGTAFVPFKNDISMVD